MAHNSNNIFAATDPGYNVSTAVYGTPGPTTPTGALNAAFYGLGLLTDNGLSEGHTTNDNSIFDMAGQLQRIIRNQETREFTFEALEENAVVLGLRYPGSSVTSSGGTAEVQTITISGVPTGGTFTVSLPGYGSYTAAYNVTTAALATALSSAFGITVTVTGTAGTSYVVTFPIASGNVPQMLVDGSGLTGGTTPGASVATTTPGVNGTNTRDVGAGTLRNLRAWVLDVIDGAVNKRVWVPNGEAVMTGTVAYTSSGAAISQFTLTAYPDSIIGGKFFRIIDNNPASALTFS